MPAPAPCSMDDGVWQERGKADVKLKMHNLTSRVRLVAHSTARTHTHTPTGRSPVDPAHSRILLNMLVQPESSLVAAPSEADDRQRAFVFEGDDYSGYAHTHTRAHAPRSSPGRGGASRDGPTVDHRMFALRFKTEDAARMFARVYAHAQAHNQSLLSGHTHTHTRASRDALLRHVIEYVQITGAASSTRAGASASLDDVTGLLGELAPPRVTLEALAHGHDVEGDGLEGETDGGRARGEGMHMGAASLRDEPSMHPALLSDADDAAGLDAVRRTSTELRPPLPAPLPLPFTALSSPMTPAPVTSHADARLPLGDDRQPHHRTSTLILESSTTPAAADGASSGDTVSAIITEGEVTVKGDVETAPSQPNGDNAGRDALHDENNEQSAPVDALSGIDISTLPPQPTPPAAAVTATAAQSSLRTSDPPAMRKEDSTGHVVAEAQSTSGTMVILGIVTVSCVIGAAAITFARRNGGGTRIAEAVSSFLEVLAVPATKANARA